MRPTTPFHPNIIAYTEKFRYVIFKQQVGLNANMLGEIMRLTAPGKKNCPKEGCFRQTFRPFKHFYFCPDRCIGYATIELLSANVALSSNWKRSSTLVVSPKRKSEVLIVHVCSCAPFLRFHSYEEPVSQSNAPLWHDVWPRSCPRTIGRKGNLDLCICCNNKGK